MAALARNLQFCRRKIIQISQTRNLVTTRCVSADGVITETARNNETAANSDEFVDEIELKRDVSGLSERQAAKLNHRAKIFPPKYEHELTLKFKRQQYAQFGRESGIDPAIMWPTKQELADMKADEMEWDLTFDQLVEKVRKDEENARMIREERIQKVEKAMAKMPELIAGYEQRLKAKEEQMKKQEEKKQKLLEEAHEFFGYEIDSRDARFKQLQELKDKEEAKLAKQRKKEAKLARLQAKLTGVAS
ncbi:large ribosomal subunit protein mL64-like [Tubulanus polymorphus]|uniref:large ribosomal subunit protein mL64-like n=1 Tax=Tubulanus polymorphus TaxID=672921 RepID=UPI003DA5DFF5